MPGESIVYFGDTGRVPYGTKSDETILKYVRGDICFLMEFDLKLIIVACGTASSIALPVLGGDYPLPIIGVVEPAVRYAAAHTRSGKVGVIGTQSTIASGSYERLLREAQPELTIVSQACPLFVPLVENGCTDGEIARLVVEQYLAPIRAADVDTLILGCTHYPLLEGVIARYMGENVTLVDPGRCTAAEVNGWLAGRDMLAHNGPADRRFFVSDSVDGFTQLASLFLEMCIDGAVSKVDIEKY